MGASAKTACIGGLQGARMVNVMTIIEQNMIRMIRHIQISLREQDGAMERVKRASALVPGWYLLSSVLLSAFCKISRAAGKGLSGRGGICISGRVYKLQFG